MRNNYVRGNTDVDDEIILYFVLEIYLVVRAWTKLNSLREGTSDSVF
jgi:hypothetical protein